MTPIDKPIVFTGRDGTRWIKSDPGETTAEPSFSDQRVKACDGVYELVRGDIRTNIERDSTP